MTSLVPNSGYSIINYYKLKHSPNYFKVLLNETLSMYLNFTLVTRDLS